MAVVTLRLLVGAPEIKRSMQHRLNTDEPIEDIEQRITAMYDEHYASDPHQRNHVLMHSDVSLGIVGMWVTDPTRVYVEKAWSRMQAAARKPAAAA